MNIIELAKQAGFKDPTPADGYMGNAYDYRDGKDSGGSLTRFAALVRAEVLEESAGVCENTLAHHYMKQVTLTHDQALLLAACADCAAAIRKLKEMT